jgi:hypothetical protein
VVDGYLGHNHTQIWVGARRSGPIRQRLLHRLYFN